MGKAVLQETVVEMSLIRSEWVFAPNNSPDYTEIRVVGRHAENEQDCEKANDTTTFKNEV